MAPTVSKVMIGDWLLVDGKVTKVTKENIVYVLNTLCQPIPLLPEILEKNGWEKEEDAFVLTDDNEKRIEFYPKETNYTNGSYGYINAEAGCISLTELPINYVHELQRFMDLCEMNSEFSDVIFKGYDI